MSQFFTSGSQNIGASASASVFPMYIQDLFHLRLTGSISLQSKGLSNISPTPQFKKYQLFPAQFFFFMFPLTSTHDYWKNIDLTRWTFVAKVTSLLFNMLSRLVTVFLPRSMFLLISWPQSLNAVILEPNKIKSVPVFIVSPSIFHEVMGLDAMIFIF